MIYAFTGKTGSGKTFNIVKHVYKRWKKGIDIFTNTPLFFCDWDIQSVRANIIDHPSAFSNFEHAFFWLKKTFCDLAHKPYSVPERGRVVFFEFISEITYVRNGVILFDEAQRLFNARYWESLPADFSNKLQQHRKHQLDLYCTTQNMGTIDINYRRLVQKWYHYTNLLEIKGRGGKTFFGLFRMEEKDAENLEAHHDYMLIPTIHTRFFLIHLFSRALYDTFFDIGFRRYQSICLTQINEMGKKEQMFLVMPKEMSLSDGLKDIRLLNMLSNPTRSSYSRKS
jgi:hypothetical protein